MIWDILLLYDTQHVDNYGNCIIILQLMDFIMNAALIEVIKNNLLQSHD